MFNLKRLLPWLGLALLLLLAPEARGQAGNIVQDSSASRDGISGKRLALVVGGEAAVFSGAMAVLWDNWYKHNDHIPFHWYNDNAGWLQIDKFGHAYSAYVESMAGYHAMRWAGMSNKQAAIYGGTVGFVLQTSIEILDGISEGWGASPGDLVANTVGSLLVTGQYLGWKEQRVRMKFSYSPTPYRHDHPWYFGTNPFENFIRDYNGHTYWFSAGPRQFFPESRWPRWLNVSLGYGADGMLGEFTNPARTYDASGRPMPYVPEYPRQRQFYLSLDIDWTQIPTRSKALRTFFHVINFIKVPAPALEFNRTQGVVLHPVYF